MNKQNNIVRCSGHIVILNSDSLLDIKTVLTAPESKCHIWLIIASN